VVDWSAWLEDDTIATSTWEVPTGITKDSDDKTDSTATIWVSGGVVTKTYSLVNRITTAGGRTADKTVKFKITDK